MRASGETWLKWKYPCLTENRLLEQSQKSVNWSDSQYSFKLKGCSYQKSKTPERITSASSIIFRGCLSILLQQNFLKQQGRILSDLKAPCPSVATGQTVGWAGQYQPSFPLLPAGTSQNPMEWTEDLTMIIQSRNLLKNPSGLFCVVELRPNLLFICPLVTANWCCLRATRFISAPHKVSMKFITSITQGRDKQHHQSGCLRTSQDWLFYKTTYIWGSKDLIKKLNALGRVNSSINLFDVYVNKVAKANSTNICPQRRLEKTNGEIF